MLYQNLKNVKLKGQIGKSGLRIVYRPLNGNSCSGHHFCIDNSDEISENESKIDDASRQLVFVTWCVVKIVLQKELF